MASDPFGPLGPRLGGNLEGTREIPGTTSAYTYRDFSTMREAEEFMRRIQAHSNSGLLVPIEETVISQDSMGGYRLHIRMQHMGYSRSGIPAIQYGDLRHIGGLRDLLPEHQLLSVRNDILSKLAQHPDGHGMNVMWRLVNTRNGYRVDVHLVDPFDKAQTLDEAMDTLRWANNPFTRQYNIASQAGAIDGALGLPPRPHPYQVRHQMQTIANGYGYHLKNPCNPKANKGVKAGSTKFTIRRIPFGWPDLLMGLAGAGAQTYLEAQEQEKRWEMGGRTREQAAQEYLQANNISAHWRAAVLRNPNNYYPQGPDTYPIWLQKELGIYVPPPPGEWEKYMLGPETCLFPGESCIR